MGRLRERPPLARSPWPRRSSPRPVSAASPASGRVCRPQTATSPRRAQRCGTVSSSPAAVDRVDAPDRTPLQALRRGVLVLRNAQSRDESSESEALLAALDYGGVGFDPLRRLDHRTISPHSLIELINKFDRRDAFAY